MTTDRAHIVLIPRARSAPSLDERPVLSLSKGPVLSLKFTLSKVEGKEIGIVFAYFQNFGPFLALLLDITLETIPSPRQENPYSALPSSCLVHACCPYNLHTMNALMSRSNPP